MLKTLLKKAKNLPQRDELRSRRERKDFSLVISKTLRPSRLCGSFFQCSLLNSKIIHKTVAKIAPELPYECVLVSVRRQGVLLVPHGDTVILPDDVLNVFLRRTDEEQLRSCLGMVENGEE